MEELERLFLDFMQMRDFARDPFLFAEGDGIYVTDVYGSGTSTGSLGCSSTAWAIAIPPLSTP